MPSGPAPGVFYLIAVGGTAMAPLAALLVERGETVLGSDLPLYPPMSDRIAALGIEVRPGFEARNLPERVDSVVVGNLAGRDNPELVEALRRGLPVASMPQTLHDEFLVRRHPVVVAGTHGKTTTSALTAWLLHDGGLAPGYLIGGEPLNFPSPSAIGRGAPFVVEGDEYSTSWADKGPKFLHYAPRTLILTSVEFDHADLYPDLDAVKAAFRSVVALVPESGTIIANTDDAGVLDVLGPARARVLRYALSDGESGGDADLTAEAVQEGQATRFDVLEKGRLLFHAVSPLAGRHNVGNALAAVGAARILGLPGEMIARSLGSFLGVKRRLEERGTAGGVTVIDDFAHHPTAVALTIDGARCRYPGRRLWAVFEPRSMTAGRADFAGRYEEALGRADAVALAYPFHGARLARPGAAGALDAEALTEALRRKGKEALAARDAATIADELARRVRRGDVVLVMSSGNFGGLVGKLLATLTSRARSATGASNDPRGADPGLSPPARP